MYPPPHVTHPSEVHGGYFLACYDTNYSCSGCPATKTYSFGRGSLEIGWALKMHQYLRTISELCLRRHMQKAKYEMGPKMVRVSFEPLFVASPMSSDVKTWPHVTLEEPSELSDSPAKSALSSNWSVDNLSRVLIGGESWRPRCGAQRDYFNGQYKLLTFCDTDSFNNILI